MAFSKKNVTDDRRLDKEPNLHFMAREVYNRQLFLEEMACSYLLNPATDHAVVLLPSDVRDMIIQPLLKRFTLKTEIENAHVLRCGSKYFLQRFLVPDVNLKKNDIFYYWHSRLFGVFFLRVL